MRRFLLEDQDVKPYIDNLLRAGTSPSHPNDLILSHMPQKSSQLHNGDYAVVQVTEAKGHTLRGKLLWRTDSITALTKLACRALTMPVSNELLRYGLCLKRTMLLQLVQKKTAET